MPKSHEDELFHYGVKGMKWGVSRDDAVLARIGGRRMTGQTKTERKETDQRYKEYKKSTTRKERKADRAEVAMERGKMILDEALKNPTRLVALGSPSGGAPMLMEGREFVKEMGKGRAFSPMDSAITDLELRDLAGR